MKGKIAKVDGEKRLAFGWASMSGIEDLQGDKINIDELENAAYDFVLHSRAGGEMHETIGVAELVESMVFTPEKKEVLGAPDLPEGWWVGFKVYDDDVWSKIKSGEYSMFSIAGKARRVENE